MRPHDSKLIDFDQRPWFSRYSQIFFFIVFIVFFSNNEFFGLCLLPFHSQKIWMGHLFCRITRLTRFIRPPKADSQALTLFCGSKGPETNNLYSAKAFCGGSK
jgi:hypothetical protein